MAVMPDNGCHPGLSLPRLISGIRDRSPCPFSSPKPKIYMKTCIVFELLKCKITTLVKVDYGIGTG